MTLNDLEILNGHFSIIFAVTNRVSAIRLLGYIFTVVPVYIVTCDQRRCAEAE